LAAASVAVPEGVVKGVVRLTDERRYDVPAVLVCPEFSPEEAKAWLAGGNLPELAKVKHLEYVDIDSGHWPMVTKPAELARLLASAA
jgi:pimeloyl-ACP methyl ester carboxylesterase